MKPPVFSSSQERQLQSYTGMLESFRTDLSYLQQNCSEGKRVKAKELEELRVREEYLHYEVGVMMMQLRKCFYYLRDGRTTNHPASFSQKP